MYIIKIKSILSIRSITPGSPEDQHPGAPVESLRMHASGTHAAAEPSKGSVTASVELLQGVLPENGRKAWFLDGNFALNCYLVASPGSNEAAFFFNQVFMDGFQAGMADFLIPETFVIGMSDQEWENMRYPEMQERLLQSLAFIYCPNKISPIMDLGRSAYILQPTQEENPVISHFSGSPKLGACEKIPVSRNGRQMIHLATLKMDEITSTWQDITTPALQYLGFYVALDELENGWTAEEEVECCVLHYQQQKEAKYKDDIDYVEAEFVTFEERLELPDSQHPVIYTLHLSDEELEQYDALRECWNEILGFANVDVSKLLGYPDSVQECVAYEAERTINQGAQPDDADAANWILLLQLSPYSEDLSLFEYLGDASFYFMILKKDLERGDFGAVKVILQNT
jgi:uncharacterized protein YwqG